MLKAVAAIPPTLEAQGSAPDSTADNAETIDTEFLPPGDTGGISSEGALGTRAESEVQCIVGHV